MIMKKLILSIAVVATGFFNSVSAQLPNYGVLTQNVVVTDLNGVQHDFYSILDSGRPIFLNMFAEWCGPCRNYYNAGHFNTLYNTYGQGGSNEVYVIAVETDPNTAPSLLQGGQGTQGWDWITNTDYPLADQNIGGIFNQPAYPYIVMICPDRTVTNVGQQTAATFYSAAQGCSAAPTASNDPRIIGHESDAVFCQGQDAVVRVALQNFGTTNLTSCSIEVFDGANSVASINWSGNLAQFEVELVTIGTVAPASATTYTAQITSANDDTSNDQVQVAIAPAPVLEVNQQNPQVTFDLVIDAYASELGVVFNEGTPPTNMTHVQIHNNAAANPSNYLGFLQVGSLSNGTTTWNQTFSANNPGCHYALFVDSFGDGINFQAPNAKIDILGAGQSSISVDPGFGSHVFSVFDLNFVAGASVSKEEFARNMRLYPNPATTSTNLEFTNAYATNTVISVVNALGQEVFFQNLGLIEGTHTVELSTASFISGIYFVNVKTDATVATKRLSVNN
jgi:thiol-disulfide isomerase/thioredoxin